MTGGNIVVLVITLLALGVSFARRKEPREPIRRPLRAVVVYSVLLAVCVVFAVQGEGVAYAGLAAFCAVVIGVVLSGRNPWWLGRPAKRERRYTSDDHWGA